MADQIIPYSDLRGGTGIESANPVINLANAARGFACDLYRKAPYGIIPPVIDTPVANAVRGGWDSLMNNMCSDMGPLPPGKKPRFQGGQCYGTRYRVTTVYQLFGLNYTSVADLLGPIGYPTIFGSVTKDIELSFSYTYRDGNGDQPGRWPLIFTAGTPGNPGNISSWKVISHGVVPINGPDNCGDENGGRGVQGTGPGDYSGNRPYRSPDGIRDAPVTIPPIIYAPIGPINVTPVLNVNIGEVNFVFDLRGAKILPIELNFPVTIGGGPGGSNPLPGSPGEGLDGEALGDRFDRLEDLLEDIEKCACGDTTALWVNQVRVNSRTGIVEQLPQARNRYCAIQLTTVPINAKKQPGGNAADVLYAGWAWFSSNQGYLSERMPIDAQGKTFKNPGAYPNFHYTLYSGYLCSVFVLDKPLKQPPTPTPPTTPP